MAAVTIVVVVVTVAAMVVMVVMGVMAVMVVVPSICDIKSSTRPTHLIFIAVWMLLKLWHTLEEEGSG